MATRRPVPRADVLIVDFHGWRLTQARRWLKENGYRTDRLVYQDRKLQFLQRPAKEVLSGLNSFRIVHAGAPGVSFFLLEERLTGHGPWS